MSTSPAALDGGALVVGVGFAGPAPEVVPCAGLAAEDAVEIGAAVVVARALAVALGGAGCVAFAALELMASGAADSFGCAAVTTVSEVG